MGYEEETVQKSKTRNLQKIDKAMFSTSSVIEREYKDVSYAVADKHNHLVGWIWFCVDKRHPIPRRVANRFGLNGAKIRQYQVVYEKLLSIDWPVEILAKTIHVDHSDLHSERKGVIVEGLRLAILRLKREYRKLYVKKRSLALYAYVLPDNIASQKVLQKNGFAKEERQYVYDGLTHDLWIRII